MQMLMHTTRIIDGGDALCFLNAVNNSFMFQGWIICNEIISILENIKDIGAPVPPFLLPLLKNLKSQVEEVAKTEEKEEE